MASTEEEKGVGQGGYASDGSEDDGAGGSSRSQQVVVPDACLRCKASIVAYENDPCGCPSWCRTCAMKV